MPSRDGLRAAALRLEPITSILALLVIPALLIETRAVTAEWRLAGVIINWIVWVAFCIEFALFFLADPAWRTVRRRWLDVAIILLTPPFLIPEYLQTARTARVVRFARVVQFARIGLLVGVGLRHARRIAGHHQFQFVALFGLAVVVLGALGVFLVEGDVNPAVSSFGNAIWWAVVTATTVGYGDVSPVSAEGRLIAVALMLTGIGVIGAFTATIASLFLQSEVAETRDLSTRLDAIERKLDQLLAAKENDADR